MPFHVDRDAIVEQANAPLALQNLLDQGVEAAESIETLVEWMESDPALSKRIVAAVNASFLADQQHVFSVADALSRLGMPRAKVIVVGTVLALRFRPEAAAKFDLQGYCIDSLSQSLLVCKLARYLQGGERIAWLAALMRPLGCLLLAHFYPQEIAHLVESESAESWIDLESQLAGAGSLNTTQLAADVVTNWGANSALQAAIIGEPPGENDAAAELVVEMRDWLHAKLDLSKKPALAEGLSDGVLGTILTSMEWDQRKTSDYVKNLLDSEVGVSLRG